MGKPAWQQLFTQVEKRWTPTRRPTSQSHSERHKDLQATLLLAKLDDSSVQCAVIESRSATVIFRSWLIVGAPKKGMQHDCNHRQSRISRVLVLTWAPVAIEAVVAAISVISKVR